MAIMNNTKGIITLLAFFALLHFSCVDFDDYTLQYKDFNFNISRLTIGTTEVITKTGDTANGKVILISNLEESDDYYLSVSFSTGEPGGLRLWTTKVMVLEQPDGSAIVSEYSSDLQIGSINASTTSIVLEFKIDGNAIKPVSFPGSQDIIKLTGVIIPR